MDTMGSTPPPISSTAAAAAMAGEALLLFLREKVAFLPSHIRGGVGRVADDPPSPAATPGSDDAGSGDGGEARGSSTTR